MNQQDNSSPLKNQYLKSTTTIGANKHNNLFIMNLLQLSGKNTSNNLNNNSLSMTSLHNNTSKLNNHHLSLKDNTSLMFLKFNNIFLMSQPLLCGKNTIKNQQLISSTTTNLLEPTILNNNHHQLFNTSPGENKPNNLFLMFPLLHQFL